MDWTLAAINLASAVVGFFVGRRNANKTQRDELIQTLKDVIEAQGRKIDGMDEEIKVQTQQIIALEGKVEDLQRIIVSQRLTIEALERQLQQ